MKPLLTATVVAVFVVLALPVVAHHSYAATYHLDREQALRGTVLQVSFRHPHTYVHLEAPDEAGVLRRWSLEWRDTDVLAATGVTRQTLRAGDPLDVIGHPARNPEAHLLLIMSLSRASDGWTWGHGEDD